MNQRPKILLTSFQTWLPHQKSNSSDDLLEEIQKLDYSHYVELFFLRHLPVDIESASKRTIAEIDRLQPNLVLCCGMAEKRTKLTLESRAFCQNRCLSTAVDLLELARRLIVTEVSYDAGKFVCEGLYYRILEYLKIQNQDSHCIFIHVPLLTSNNLDPILEDFHYLFLSFAEQLDLLTRTD